MKIACIATSKIPSNTANSIQVMKACQGLAQNGHEVLLLIPGNSQIEWEQLAAHYGIDTRFEIIWLSSNRMLKRYDLAFKTIQQARAWGAEVVYTWMTQVACLALIQKLPVVLEMHDMPTGKIGPRLFKQFVSSKGKKRLMCITQALLDKLEQQYSFSLPQEETLIAPNGTEPEHYAGLPSAEEARRELGLKEGLTVGYTGHFYAGRGMELMQQLVPAFPNVNFLFVGGQPEKVLSWQNHLKVNNLTNTYSTGFIKNSRLPLYQAAADILLMPYERSIAGSSGGNSAEICSPMKMFDYLSSGRAIITSDLPVLHEVLNENNAVFCPPEDAQAWINALNELVKNDEKREKLSAQAKEDAAGYSWKARAERSVNGFS